MKHTVPGPWNGKDFDRLPAAFVVMRTDRTRNGPITTPLSAHPTPESAIERIVKLVSDWSMYSGQNGEDCPAFYFQPVEAAP